MGGAPKTRGRLAASAALGCLAFASAAEAQTAPASTDQAPGGPAVLQEVVVTAQKRSENLQKTPISISALSGADLERRGETELDTALRNVPALQIQGTPQGGEIYIRGVGANGDSNFVDPSVAVSLDGVYTARSERLAAPLYDISRIEVLRGPQGTLYGRNADGGTVNIISNDPTFDALHTRVNFQFGNYDLLHVDASENLPVSDNLAFRVAALREDRGGYFSNGGYSSHVTGLRLKALYEPSTAFTLKGFVDYSQQTGLLGTSVPVAGSLPSPPFPSGGWATKPGDPWYVDPYHPADTVNYRFLISGLEADYRADWATLTLIPTFTHSSRYVLTNQVVGDYFGPLTATSTDEDQYTLEARLASPSTSRRLKWIVGFYYLWSNNSQPPGVPTTQTGNLADGTSIVLFNSYTAGAPPATSIAPFGQATWSLTDRLRLTGGARYTQDEKSQAVDIVSVYTAGYDSGKLISTSKYSAFTYKFDIEYDLTRASMLYALIARGYKAGGYDTTAVPPKAYSPEFVTDYEIGSKNRFLKDTLQVNASFYYYKYDDIQVQYNPAESPPIPLPAAYIPSGATYSYFQQYIANGGAGVNTGAELETAWKFTPHDELDVSATYIDAHYGKFADTNLSGLSNEAMAATPKYTGVINYSHTWPVGRGLVILQADSKLSTKYWTSVNNRGSRPDSLQAGYTRSDASLVFDSGKEWTISLWVKNIENRAQIQFGDFPLNRNVINAPRTFGTNIALKF